MDLISCAQFYCDRRKANFCCALCPDPCGNRCLNHPDRCKLTKDAPPNARPTRKAIPPEVKEAMIRRLKEGELSVHEIAKELRVSDGTVAWYRDKLKREAEADAEQ